MADLAVTPTTFIPKKLATGQLAAASAVLYTVPADTATKVTTILLVNDTTTTATVTFHFCDNGGGETDLNIICKTMSIPPCVPVILNFGPHGFYLNATDTIEGFASAADQITYHISGVEESA